MCVISPATDSRVVLGLFWFLTISTIKSEIKSMPNGSENSFRFDWKYFLK